MYCRHAVKSSHMYCSHCQLSHMRCSHSQSSRMYCSHSKPSCSYCSQYRSTYALQINLHLSASLLSRTLNPRNYIPSLHAPHPRHQKPDYKLLHLYINALSMIPPTKKQNRVKTERGKLGCLILGLLSVLTDVLKTTHEWVTGNTRNLSRTFQRVLITVHFQRALQWGHELDFAHAAAYHSVDCEQVLGSRQVQNYYKSRDRV